MRFLKAKRSRSAMWRAVFSFALLLFGAYVFFDVLDLDGSQMTGWSRSDIIVDVEQQVNTARLMRAELATPGSSDLVPPSLLQLLSMEIGRILPSPTILRIRQSRLLPRVSLHQGLASQSSPTSDPASRV